MTSDDLTHDRAFSLLGDPIRVDIIRILGEGDGSQSFSELYSAVGIRDSGRFNYHLQQLEGIFVKRDGDGMYHLTFAGNRALGALYTGEFLKGEVDETLRIDSDCTTCGGQLEATYKTEQVTVQCSECQAVATDFGFPQGGLKNRTPEELTTVFDSWLRNLFYQALSGLCMNCTGTVKHEFVEDVEYLDWEQPIVVSFRCQQCGYVSAMSVRTLLYLSETVRAYFIQHDVEIPRVPLWSTEQFFEIEVDSIESDPWSVLVSASLDGQTGTFRIDDDLSIEVQ